MIRLHEDDQDELPSVEGRATAHVKPKRKKLPKPDSAEEKPQSAVEQHTIFRSRHTGEPITEQEWLEQQQKRRSGKDAKKPRLTEKELPHGGGIIQRQLIEVGEQHAQEILEAGFHRTEIQLSLDEELRNEQRSEDPMKEFLTKQRAEVDGEGDREGGRGRSRERNATRFVAPANRFGIKAGSKWDGRVRGTGFEEKYLEALRALDKEQPISDDEE